MVALSAFVSFRTQLDKFLKKAAREIVRTRMRLEKTPMPPRQNVCYRTRSCIMQATEVRRLPSKSKSKIGMIDSLRLLWVANNGWVVGKGRSRTYGIGVPKITGLTSRILQVREKKLDLTTELPLWGRCCRC